MSEGTMGGAPKGGGGSMLPSGYVEEKKREKELASLEESTGKQDRVDEEKAEKKEDARKKRIDDLLPKEVESAYGLVEYDEFKKIYADVYDGVKEKDHWATGFVTHEAKLPGGLPFKMRNFRRGEGDAIRALMPRGAGFGGDADTFHRENSRFVAARITLALMEWGGQEMAVLPSITIDNIDKWFEQDLVKKAIKFLDDMPDQLVTFLDAVVNDIMVAYNAAATENLKNQLAPLSPTTD